MKKVFLTLTMLLFAFMGTMRAESLTVNDGTATNGNVPVYGFYADAYNKCEMVYPADELSEMAGGTINSLTFYASSPASEAWTGTFQVFLSEVAEATISAFAGPGTIVYEGTLDGTQPTMTITFNAPYAYNGGNLLVGVYQTATGNYKSVTWAGETVTGASGSGYNYSNLASCTFTQRNFLPKATFDYTPGGGGELVEVTIGDPTSTTTNSYLPGYSLYDYAISQQIYTADEIGVAGTINTLTMWLKNSSSYARNINVYMKETEASVFASTSAWESFTASDMVASFTMPNANSTPIEVAIDLSTPFEYSGNDNLVICFQDVTGQWSSGLGGVVMDASGNQAIYAYRDGTVYDPSNPGVNGTLLTKKNVVKLAIMTGGSTPTPVPVVVDVITDPIDLNIGYRPIGYWMEPYTFNFYTVEAGTTATITSVINGQNAYMNVTLETPATICDTVGAEATVVLGTAAAGEITEEFAIDFNGRGLKAFQITGTAYEAPEGDVWENAIEVASLPFNGTAPAGIHKNYNIENSAPDAADAIYKVTLENEVLLSAGTNAANGVARLYAEDFNGQPGPMVDNHFVYSAGGGTNYPPTDTWFTGYEYTGGNTFFGTSAGGGIIYGYKVPASMLNGLGHCYLTTVEAAAREAYPYDLYVMRGGETPADAELVYYQEMPEPATAYYFFDMDIDEPFAIGQDEDLWVMFYSESPYAAYCGKNPDDVENGKIWYTVNGTTWYSNETYTPVIALHLVYPNPLEERGEVVLNLPDMSIQTFGNGTVSEAKGNVNMPVHRNVIAPKRDGYPMLYNEFIPAGTYYLAVASTEENFDVYIQTEEVPAPEQAVIINPEDGDHGVNNGDMFQWTLGQYTTEFQIILGTQFPPTDVYQDWTSNLYETMPVAGLMHNKTYFMQINERNSTGTTYGEIIGFTTMIDGVTGFAAESENLYPGENAVLVWNANMRTLQGYNLYMDEELVNEEPIMETTYTVENLDYNMEGYEFTITALYDEGESEPSEPVVVRMTGFGTVYGTVYEQDGTTVVEGATVQLRGVDEYGEAQAFTTTTGADGTYEVDVLAGTGYQAFANKDGYQECPSEEVFSIMYEEEVDGIDVLLYEYYAPLGQITATLQEEENNVLVEWSWDPAEMIVDFETGDFSQAEFVLPATYPWAVTTTNPHEGTYCMKSTCEGIASASSTIEVVVDVPFEEAKMGFYVRTSSESNYDKFHFYIDGVEQGQALSGNNPYTYKEYAVTGGTHTYKWEYTKDSSVNSNDDCIYVDDITLFRKDIPLPPVQGATTYDFEDETMMGWTSIDADADGYGWVSSGNPGQYHNAGVSLAGTGHNASQGYVISGSYSNSAGVALNPDNYLVAPTQISAVNGAQIQFYACAQDGNYAAEHFGVAVSTTTATAAAFTTIQEWTMTAKSVRGGGMEAERDVRGLRQGNWYLYTVDLSTYAGQDIWVAIRHFNCYDMFILNVDDIVLADGSAKRVAESGRSLQGFNLYRRNLLNGEEQTGEVISQPGIDVMSYVDEAWANLPYGSYQWGIQALYDGNRDNRNEVVIGEGATTNSYLPTYTYYNYSLTEQIYTADELGGAGTISSVSFFNTGDSRIREIAVYMKNTTKSVFADNYDWEALVAADKVFEGSVTFVSNDWTTITFAAPFTYSGGNLIIGVDDNTGSYQSAVSFKADNTTGPMALRIYNDYTNFDPSSPSNYSGTTLSVRNQIKLEKSGGSAPVAGDGLSEILWSNVIDKDLTSQVTVNVTLNNGQAPAGVEVAFGENTMTTDETGTVVFEALPKGDYTLTVSKEGFTTYTEQVAINQNVMVFNVTLMEDIYAALDLYVSPTGWAKWAGEAPGGPVNPPTPPTPTGQWYYYDDGTLYNNIGASGAFYWAVMFPAGTYTGDFVTKVATYDAGNAGYAFTGTATIYQGGTTAPGTAVGTVDVATTGASEDFVEFEFAEPVNIDDSQNLWVVFYNATSTSYCASAFAYSGNDTNTRWVSLDGSSWLDLANAGVSGCGWMLRVYVAEGAKGEVHEISVPTQLCENSGKLSAVPAAKANRSALSYKVMIDGLYEGETQYPYFQHDVTNFEEGSEHVTAVAGIYATGMGPWEEYTWTYTPCDEFTGATGVAAEQQGSTVKIEWTLPGGSGPTPPPTPPTGGWTEDFEGGAIPTGWATIDADGDGYNWRMASTTMGSGYGHNASGDCILSQSYDNNYGPLNPNNYLVTSQVTPTAGSTFSFWACAQDASYAAEHFGVAVSIGSQTTASDFTMLQEWTLSAKDGGVMAPGRDGQMRAQGTWREYSVDLSSYAGQNVYLAIRHFNCTDMFYIDVDDVTFTTAAKGNRAMWDYVTSFTGTSAGQQGVATDGQYIYTVSWQSSPTGGYTFYQYDLQGNFIEGFNIAGATQIRDLTTDGEYFYGTSGGAQIFCMDFTTRTLVGTINCSGLTSRHISYDPERDGFWSGNWSTLALYSRTGAQLQSGPAPTSAYGSAYYKDADNVEHLFLFCQPNSDAKVYDYNITTNTLGTSPVLDFASTPGFDGIAGGCFIGQYNGMTCWFGNSQQDPNLIGIYELAAGTGPTPPPTPPTGDVLGAYVFRDGVLISGIDPITTGSFIDAAPETGDYEYCVRVVYSDYSMSCTECVNVDYECVPVNNLTGTYTWNSTNEYGVTLAWQCAQAEYVQTYDIYYNDTILAQVTDMSYFVDMTANPGEYTFGVVANYGFCESEIVYVDVNVTGVDEVMGNVVVYPNPTNNNVTIEAASMNHITVVNALGQVVYDADVDADMLQLNLGQYNAGLYLVRINTEYGVSVKRVTVVK